MPKIDRPDDPTGGVEQEEPLPVKVVDAGQKRREGAQNRDEAAEKHDLAAVPEKQILAELQAPLVEAHVAAKPIDEAKAELPPDPIAAIVADDRPRRGRCDDAIKY